MGRRISVTGRMRPKHGEVADAQMAADALTFVIKTYARTFQEQMSAYPEAQKQLLIAIAKDGNIYYITNRLYAIWLRTEY